MQKCFKNVRFAQFRSARRPCSTFRWKISELWKYFSRAKWDIFDLLINKNNPDREGDNKNVSEWVTFHLLIIKRPFRDIQTVDLLGKLRYYTASENSVTQTLYVMYTYHHNPLLRRVAVKDYRMETHCRVSIEVIFSWTAFCCKGFEFWW